MLEGPDEAGSQWCQRVFRDPDVQVRALQYCHVLLGECQLLTRRKYNSLMIRQRDCQSAHWRKHKKQPCKAFEDIIADDELWNFFGMLKGTSWFRITNE